VPAAVVPVFIFLLRDACRGAPSKPSMVLALLEKSQAPGSSAGDGGDYVVSFLEASSWRARIQRRACVSFVDMMVDVRAVAQSGGLASRGGGLGDHVEQLFHGAKTLLACIGWQSSLVRPGCQLGVHSLGYAV
jgi:hypothetical protein